MKTKICTWNMAHWSHKKHSKESWEFFINELDCDIFLFQESQPNYDVLNKKQLVWNEIGNSRAWGSGVYAPNFNIKEHSFKTDFFGAVTVAEVQIKDDYSLVVVSLYGLMEKVMNVTYAIPNLHRIFSDLTGILEGIKTKHRVIIGGDLNASLQIDEQQVGNSHEAFFIRLKEFGLKNCFDDYYSDFVQTHRHSRSKKPWQNDYFFISNKLALKLENCEVIDNSLVREYSDHNPVIIELDL